MKPLNQGGLRVLNVGTHAQLVPGVGGSFLPETVRFGVLTVLACIEIAKKYLFKKFKIGNQVTI